MYLLAMLICLLCSTAASADMYKYTDDSGAVCMTNSLESVPKKFRPKMTIIKEDAPKPAKLLPEDKKRDRDPEPVPVVRNEQVSAEAKHTGVEDKGRYVRTAVVAVGVIAGFFLLRWLGRTLGFPGVGTLLFLLVTLLSGVYIYRMYINELSNVFGTLKKDAMNIRKNVETRE